MGMSGKDVSMASRRAVIVWSFVGSICWHRVVLWYQLIARTNVLMAPLVGSEEARREVI